MSARYKTTAESVTRTLRRPVGILPLGPRTAEPPAQKATNSVERKILKRTSSTGSIVPLSSYSTRSGPASANRRKPSGRRRSQNGVEEPEQVSRCANSEVAHPSSAQSQRCSSSRQGKRAPNISDILKLCQETEPCKVFDIDLHGKELACAPDLQQFCKLRVLDLSGNYIKKVIGLDSNKELKLYDNDISTIEGFQHLNELCCLQLQHNKLTTVGRGLSNLKKLQSLRLDNNQIARLEIPELLSCSNITTLDLSHNRLESLAPLSYLPNLEELFATGNKIKKTGDLSKCKKLQELDLSRNQISDLSGLANLPNLQILDISQNQLKTLKSVGKLRSMEQLNINANVVQELSSFASLFPNLQILFACDNNISKWDEVCSLSGCLHLVELYVTENAFSSEDGDMPDYHHTIAQALPKLEVIDGITLKKSDVKEDSTPLLRPMSASSIVSIRQVDSQLKAATDEQDSLLKNIADRFHALRMLMNSLPAESPRPRTDDSCVTATSSRCSSRARLKDARNFAAVNFNNNDAE